MALKYALNQLIVVSIEHVKGGSVVIAYFNRLVVRYSVPCPLRQAHLASLNDEC